MAEGTYDKNSVTINPFTTKISKIYRIDSLTKLQDYIDKQIKKFKDPEKYGLYALETISNANFDSVNNTTTIALGLTPGVYDCNYTLNIDDTNNEDITITITLTIIYQGNELVEFTFSTSSSKSYYYVIDTDGDYSTKNGITAYTNAFTNAATIFVNTTETILYALTCMEHTGSAMNGSTLKMYMPITTQQITADYAS